MSFGVQDDRGKISLAVQVEFKRKIKKSSKFTS